MWVDPGFDAVDPSCVGRPRIPMNVDGLPSNECMAYRVFGIAARDLKAVSCTLYITGIHFKS